MSEFSRISFIGAGNVAWHLAPAMENGGFAVSEVFSRDIKNAEKLVKRLYDARAKKNLDFSTSNADIYIISVPDDVIEDVAREIVLPDEATLLHTSGSTSLEILAFSAVSSIGVFYPLQTFSKEHKVDFREIPILIEGSNEQVVESTTTVAKALSKKVISATSEERKAIHLAAVFASNFTNHILFRSKGIIENKGFDFDILKPLIVETIAKSLKIGPELAQTGPAKRQDLSILDEHILLLEDETLREIYRIISQDIIDQYS